MTIIYKEQVLPSGAIIKTPIQQDTEHEEILQPPTLEDLNEKLNLLMQMQLESEGII